MDGLVDIVWTCLKRVDLLINKQGK